MKAFLPPFISYFHHLFKFHVGSALHLCRSLVVLCFSRECPKSISHDVRAVTVTSHLSLLTTQGRHHQGLLSWHRDLRLPTSPSRANCVHLTLTFCTTASPIKTIAKMGSTSEKGPMGLGSAPLNFIYSCSLCSATFADVYEGHNESVRGLSDGINPKDRLVTRLFLANCCHVFCSNHLEGGGKWPQCHVRRLLIITQDRIFIATKSVQKRRALCASKRKAIVSLSFCTRFVASTRTNTTL